MNKKKRYLCNKCYEPLKSGMEYFTGKGSELDNNGNKIVHDEDKCELCHKGESHE